MISTSTRRRRYTVKDRKALINIIIDNQLLNGVGDVGELTERINTDGVVIARFTPSGRTFTPFTTTYIDSLLNWWRAPGRNREIGYGVSYVKAGPSQPGRYFLTPADPNYMGALTDEEIDFFVGGQISNYRRNATQMRRAADQCQTTMPLARSPSLKKAIQAIIRGLDFLSYELEAIGDRFAEEYAEYKGNGTNGR